MADPDVVLPEITGHPSHEYSDQNRNADGDKADGQRYPGALEHPGKDIAAQIIGSEKIYAQRRNLIRLQSFRIGSGQRRQQFFLQSDQGGIKNRFAARGQNQAGQGAEEKQNKNGHSQNRQPVSFKKTPELLPAGCASALPALPGQNPGAGTFSMDVVHSLILGSTTMYSKSEIKVPAKTSTADTKLTVRITG